jgi:hypothetical protein
MTTVLIQPKISSTVTIVPRMAGTGKRFRHAIKRSRAMTDFLYSIDSPGFSATC